MKTDSELWIEIAEIVDRGFSILDALASVAPFDDGSRQWARMESQLLLQFKQTAFWQDTLDRHARVIACLLLSEMTKENK